jgi:hypothetical protein
MKALSVGAVGSIFLFIDHDRQIGLVRYVQKNLVEATTALSMFGRDTASEICVPSAKLPSKEELLRILKRSSQIASRLSEHPAIKRGKCNTESDRVTENTLNTSLHCTISWSSVIFGIPACHCCTQNPVDVIISCFSVSSCSRFPLRVSIGSIRDYSSTSCVSLPLTFYFIDRGFSIVVIGLLERNYYCP